MLMKKIPHHTSKLCMLPEKSGRSAGMLTTELLTGNKFYLDINRKKPLRLP